MPPIRPYRVLYPLSAVMFHRNSIVLVGNALAFTIDALQDFTHYAAQTVAANGDTFITSFFLGGGVYTLNVLGQTQSSCGKIDWYIDGVKVVSGQDWYSGATVRDVVKNAAVTVTYSGEHVLKGVVNGLTVPSGGYAIPLTAMALV